MHILIILNYIMTNCLVKPDNNVYYLCDIFNESSIIPMQIIIVDIQVPLPKGDFKPVHLANPTLVILILIWKQQTSVRNTYSL